MAKETEEMEGHPCLGLRGGAKLHEFLGLVSSHARRKVRDLVQQAYAYAARHGLAAAFNSLEMDRRWRISFHPAATDIIIDLQGGYVVLHADTLEAGPGYHAFVVGFIDYLSQEHRWVWDFRSATRHFADNTGFYLDRDFTALQAAMASELSVWAGALVERQGHGFTPYNLWLPLEFNIASDRFVATSLGFRDRSFFAPPKPEMFFPWWDQGVTAQTAKNVALCKMWLETVWHSPVNAEERRDLENVRNLIDHALDLGATFTDSEGVDDIDTLLHGKSLNAADNVGRIGYWRQDVWYQVTHNWSVALPACYREEIIDGGQSCALAYGDRVVYVTSELYETEQAQLEWPEPMTEGFRDYLRFETDTYRAVVGVSETNEVGPLRHVWQATYAAREGLAVVTAMSSRADDAAWAEKALRSVRVPDSIVTEDMLDTDGQLTL